MTAVARSSGPASSPARGAGPWHLLDLRSLPQDEWNGLLERAATMAGPDGRRPLLAGRRVGMLFFNAQYSLQHGLGAGIVVAEIADQLAIMVHRDTLGDQILLDHVHQIFAFDIL